MPGSWVRPLTPPKAAPDAARDQLERTRADFLAGAGDADDDALAPALVAAFQRRAHHVDVADAFEREVHAAVGQLDDHVLDGTVVVLGLTQSVAPMALARMNLLGLVSMAMMRPALACTAPWITASRCRPGRTRRRCRLPDLGGVVDRAQAGGHAAAQQADLFVRRGRVDLGQRDLVDHGVFAEGRAAHVVVERLAFIAEARAAVGHDALALRGADLLAQVGLAGQAELAFAAFGRVERDDMIAGLQRGHALAHFDHHARAFVAQHGGEQALGIVAAQGEGVGMATPVCVMRTSTSPRRGATSISTISSGLPGPNATAARDFMMMLQSVDDGVASAVHDAGPCARMLPWPLRCRVPLRGAR